MITARTGAGGDAIRLQMFVNDLGATGVVRNAIGIANTASEQGFAVRLLSSLPTGELLDELGPSVTLVDLSGGGAGGQRKRQLRRAFGPYRRHTLDWRPDVLFSAGNHGHLLSTLAWSGLPGCKVLRISNALDQQGGEARLTQRWYRALKFRAMLSRADRLVLVSRALAAHPLLAPLVACGKAVVIPNGVDIDRVRRGAAQPCPHPWLRNKDRPLVLAVGRHVRQKNFEVLLHGFAMARRTGPMRLLFLGEGKPEAVESLRRRAEALGVAEDVGFEPPSPNPFSYMAAADVFALPSLWEGSSNVLLEALACGTPTIASTTAGDAGLILGQGRFGLLVPPDNPRGWADAILRQQSDLVVRPAERAQEFSRIKALERYLQLFRDCAASGAVSRPR